MCADETYIEEPTVMYGPLCWQGYVKDLGGFKKLMWYGMMKELDCLHVPSVEGLKKRLSRTNILGQKKQEETSQSDYIVGTGRRDDDVYICNDVRLWDTWDHYR